MSRQDFRVRPRQYILIIVLSVVSSPIILYPGLIYKAAHYGHWAAILAQFGVWTLSLLLWSLLLRRHPGESAGGISRKLAGRALGLLLLLPLLLWWWVQVVVLNVMQVTTASELFLPRTPPWVLALVVVVVPFIACRGIRNFALLADSLTLFAALWLSVVIFFALSDLNLDFIRPLTRIDLDFFRRPAFYSSLYPLSPVLFLVAVHPDLQRPGRMLGDSLAVLGLTFPFVLLTVYLPLLTYGPEVVARFPYPLLSKMDAIHFSLPFFESTFFFYDVGSRVFSLLVAAVLLWSPARLLADVLGFQQLRLAIWIPALATYGGSLGMVSWMSMQSAVWLAAVPELYAALLLPLLLLALTAVRGRGQAS